MQKFITALALTLLLTHVHVAVAQFTGVSASNPANRAEEQQAPPARQRLDLARCIDLALQNNNRSKISRDSVEAALAQQQQAMSSWWPKVSAGLAATRMDQDPNFVFPASQMVVPATTVNLPSTVIMLPANSLAPGFPPVDLPMTLPPLTMNAPAQTISISQQDVKLMDRDSLLGQLHVTFPIYTGGLRGAMIRQAKAGVQAARQDERRTDLEVIFDVKRLYHARILAQRLLRIGNDTLARMEATLDLTESLYKTGSGKVKKTDFLRNKAVVESIRSVVAEIEGQQSTIAVTLLMVIGLDMSTPVELADEEIPFLRRDVDVQTAIDAAYSSNPDMAKVHAGMQAAEAAVKAARSGHLPKAALFANARRLVNSYDAGMATPENKTGWAFGIGVEIPIFDGFRITNEEREARAKLQKLQHQQALLREALALEIRGTCINLNKVQQQQKSLLEAFKSAVENRELNARAYQEELVETKDVIEAQMMEALMSSQYEKILFDNAELHAKLDFVVGLEKGQQLPARK